MKLKQRTFAADGKLLIISIAVVVAGLAIALPISMASTNSTAGSIPAQSDGAGHPISGTAAHAAAGPGTGRPIAPGTGRPTARGTGQPGASGGCMVSYTPTNWPGQFMAKVTISNMGSTSISGWTLTFSFPGDQAITSAWNATFTQTGTDVSAKNMSWDAKIAPGASQSLGFMGAWRSNHADPASFNVNGAPCA